MLVLRGGRDFPRVFFEVRAPTARRRTSEALRLAAFDSEEARRVMLSRSLGAAPGTPSTTEFAAVSLAERCMLTRPLYLEGCDITPISGVTGSTDEAVLISRVLQGMRWPFELNPHAWAESATRDRPVVAFHFPRIIAGSPEEAAEFAGSLRDRLLDLLALHRGARGSPFAMLVRRAGSEELAVFRESSNYTGNMLGGFLSGEDPSELVSHARAVASDSLVALFLSLYKDALKEGDADFAYFRYWTVLEVMSGARIPEGVEISDFSGNALWTGQSRASTSKPSGRVHELIRSRLQPNSLTEGFLGIQPPDSLWSRIAVWSGYRHAAGHHGGFRVGDPIQVAQPWYQSVLDAFQQDGASGQVGLNSRYLMDLRRATELMLRWELNASG